MISTHPLQSYLTWTKVYSIVRQTCDRGPTDETDDLNVKAVTTLQAAVHLGQDHDQNLRSVEYQFWNSLKKLCKETEKLIKNQTERQACCVTNVKTYVFADSVLCLGGLKENPNEVWKEKLKWHFESDHLKDLSRIDGEPMEFEWKNFP